MTHSRRTGSIARVVVRLGLGLGLALSPAPALAQSVGPTLLPNERELVHGREATLRVGGGDVKGELLAVTVDSLWLLTRGEDLRVLPLQGVQQVRVRRHGMDAGHALLWSGLGALFTGGALTAACTQVEGGGCGGVFPVTVGMWGVVGRLFSWRIAASSRHELGPVESELRPYVRFPQGLPPGFAPR